MSHSMLLLLSPLTYSKGPDTSNNHSVTGKRNTTRPVFTSYEREQAKSNWSSKSAQLSRDSFLPFGFCSLCLEDAREPVACPRGDIFCRECALENLVAQKKELKRAEKARQNAEREAARIRAIEDEEERERAIRDFELTQAGLTTTNGGGTITSSNASNHSTNKTGKATPTSSSAAAAESANKQQDAVVLHAGSKRKFSLDADELDRIAENDKAKARKAIDDEKVRDDNPARRLSPCPVSAASTSIVANLLSLS